MAQERRIAAIEAARERPARAASFRRSQADRSGATRDAVIDGAILLLHRDGYGGTTTETVAAAAGVSRGALRHHFPTRAQLMAEVITVVYDREHQAYAAMRADGFDIGRTVDWPEMLWRVLSRPAALAVVEILQAARGDRELAALAAPVHARIEETAAAGVAARFPGADPDEVRAAIRLFVWTIRGLAIGRTLGGDADETERSVALFRRMVAASVDAGVLDAGTPDAAATPSAKGSE